MKRRVKKIISTILSGVILTTALFSVTVNAEEVDHAYGESGGVEYEGALFVEGNVYKVTATTYRPNIQYCYAELFIQYRTLGGNPIKQTCSAEAGGPAYSQSAVITDNTAPGSISELYYAKGTHSLGGGHYIYTYYGALVP
ncbi:MAG: hypothetical protein MSA01_02690 [Anaeromassilibacillus sp.]|nr:hypothetical protein [Anaeromassilibacillus sp.]MDY3779792.1 hypothetical protein [Candidatus Limousia pullorum]